MSDERTTLSEFLDLAVAAGVPAEALGRAGFYYIQGIWEVENNLGERFAVTALRGDCETRATLAAERVVIEWLSDNFVDQGDLVIENHREHGYSLRVVRIDNGGLEIGCDLDIYAPTLTAALTAALRQITGAADV